VAIHWHRKSENDMQAWFQCSACEHVQRPAVRQFTGGPIPATLELVAKRHVEQCPAG